MTLLELGDTILYGQHKKVKLPEITNDDLILFQKTINIGQKMKMIYDQTDDYNSFAAMFPNVPKIIGSKKCVECFYAYKLGYIMPGIPMKLVYILTKIFKTHDKKFVNVALNSALPLLKPYVNCIFVCGDETYSFKDVLENVLGTSVKILTSSILKMQVGDVWEVYIADAKRVALVPDGIAGMLSNDDCERLTFSRDKGILLNDIPIRTLGDRLGLTRNDFDLRDCV